jgi:hypothetical protein
MALLLSVGIVWTVAAVIGLPFCWYRLCQPFGPVDEDYSRLDRMLRVQEQAAPSPTLGLDRAQKTRGSSDDFVGLRSV